MNPNENQSQEPAASAENVIVSSSSSSGASSLPGLIQPPGIDSFEYIPGCQVEEGVAQSDLYLYLQSTQSLADVAPSVAVTQTGNTSGESVGGASDAPTAVLGASDVDVEDVELSPPVQPGPSGYVPPVREGHGSGASSLTSSSGSSVGHATPSARTGLKRSTTQPQQAGPMAKKPKGELCTSLSSDSPASTSTSSRLDTTSSTTTTAATATTTTDTTDTSLEHGDSSHEHQSDTSHDPAEDPAHDPAGNQSREPRGGTSHDPAGDRSHEPAEDTSKAGMDGTFVLGFAGNSSVNESVDALHGPTLEQSQDLFSCNVNNLWSGKLVHAKQKVADLVSNSSNRRSDCAEMNIWPSANSFGTGLTTVTGRRQQAPPVCIDIDERAECTQQNEMLSSQCDSLFDEEVLQSACVEAPLSTAPSVAIVAVRLGFSHQRSFFQSQPSSSIDIYNSPSCVPPSQTNYTTINRIRPTSPTDNGVDSQVIRYQLSPTQLPETPEQNFSGEAHHVVCHLARDSEHNCIILTEDSLIELSSSSCHEVSAKPAADTEGSHLCRSVESTSHFQLDRPVVTLVETDSSADVSAALVFRKTTPIKQAVTATERRHSDLDLDFEDDSIVMAKDAARYISQLAADDGGSGGHQPDTQSTVNYTCQEDNDDMVVDIETARRDNSSIRASHSCQPCSSVGEIVDLSARPVSELIVEPPPCEIVAERSVEEPRGECSAVQSSSGLNPELTVKQSMSSTVQHDSVGGGVKEDKVSERSAALSLVQPLVRSSSSAAVHHHTRQRRLRKKVLKGSDRSSKSGHYRQQQQQLDLHRVHNCDHCRRRRAKRNKEKSSLTGGVVEETNRQSQSLVSKTASTTSSHARRTETSKSVTDKSTTKLASQTLLTTSSAANRVIFVEKEITTYRRTVTFTTEVVGGKPIKSTVCKSKEVIETHTERYEEVQSPISEPRSPSSSANMADVSTANLADVSSAERTSLSSFHTRSKHADDELSLTVVTPLASLKSTSFTPTNASCDISARSGCSQTAAAATSIAAPVFPLSVSDSASSLPSSRRCDVDVFVVVENSLVPNTGLSAVAVVESSSSSVRQIPSSQSQRRLDQAKFVGPAGAGSNLVTAAGIVQSVLETEDTSRSRSSGSFVSKVISPPDDVNRRTTSSSLFSTESSDTAALYSAAAAPATAAAALSRCDTEVMDSSSKDDSHNLTAAFRLPFPVLPLPKRSSSSSYDSRRSSDEKLPVLNTAAAFGEPLQKTSLKKAGSTESDSLSDVHMVVDDSASASASASTGAVSVSVAAAAAAAAAVATNTTSTSSLTLPIVSETASTPVKSSKPVFRQGETVLARWKDKHYYPAVVTATDDGGSRVHVTFVDDKVAASVKSSQVVACNLVPVGVTVLAQRDDVEQSDPACIQSYFVDDRNNNSTGYVVQFVESNESARIPAGKISLTKAQIADLRDALMQSSTSVAGCPSVENEAVEKQPSVADIRTSAAAAAAVIQSVDVILPAESTSQSKLSTTKSGRNVGRLRRKNSATPSSAAGSENKKPNEPPTVDQSNEPREQLLASSEDESNKPSVNPVPVDVAKEASVEASVIASKSLGVGTAVYAEWKQDQFYYAGVVKSLSTASAVDGCQKYLVKFDDGYEGEVSVEDMVVCDLLPVGIEVWALRGNCRIMYTVAQIVEQYREAKCGYVLKYLADNSTGRVDRKKVRFRAADALSIRRAMESAQIFDFQEVEPSDNIPNVPSGRKLKRQLSTTPKSNVTTPAKTPRSTPSRRRRQAHSVDLLHSGSVKRRRSGSVGLDRVDSSNRLKSSGSNVTPPGRAKRNLMKNIEPSATSTPVLADSPLKTQPLPVLKNAANGELFAGYSFVITHVKKADSSFSADESSPIKQGVPFDKEHIQRLIESCSATIVENFTLDTVRSVKNLFLISDSHQRTQKYLMALAAGIPCLSHMWLYDSYNDSVVHDYAPYLLPAGWSIETNEIVEWNYQQKSQLYGMGVLLDVEQQQQDAWQNILRALGCKIVTSMSCARLGSRSSIDVIVADRHVSASTLHQAQLRSIAVVSLEWVIQCLITGSRLSFKGHAKYFVKSE